MVYNILFSFRIVILQIREIPIKFVITIKLESNKINCLLKELNNID